MKQIMRVIPYYLNPTTTLIDAQKQWRGEKEVASAS